MEHVRMKSLRLERRQIPLIELVGKCIRCEKDVYCTDGFLNGITVGKGNILCFSCKDNDPLMEIFYDLLSLVLTNLDVINEIYSTDSNNQICTLKKETEYIYYELNKIITNEGGEIKRGKSNADTKKSPPSSEILIKTYGKLISKLDEALKFGMDNSSKETLLEIKKITEKLNLR